MDRRFRLPIFLNPQRVFEWDDANIPNLPPDPTPERLLQFLCPIGVDSTMPAFKVRYTTLGHPSKELFFSIEEKTLAENVFGPLRSAQTSYLVANFLGCIALCGLVAEKLAILLFAVRQTSDEAIEVFEKLGQEKRVKQLKELGWITPDMVQDFGQIRGTRRGYLHRWSQPSARLESDARAAYAAVQRLIVRGFRIGFPNAGTVAIDPDIMMWLVRSGVARDVTGDHPKQP
jgi:hypothetical protein